MPKVKINPIKKVIAESIKIKTDLPESNLRQILNNLKEKHG